ncbi:hypothetical protein WI25_28690 [Burkholderia cepacia]|nr:hypothetical protein WI25_28690 [Burkholderia cepacia]
MAELFPRYNLRTWEDVDPLFGDVVFTLDGRPVFRAEYPADDERLPAVIDNDQTVTGDLIPESSFGASLYNLLTDRSWDALRLPLIEANHHVCQLCGIQRHSLDVHEIWDYEFPPDEEIERVERLGEVLFGTQRLAGLMSVCDECHLCFHLGFANSRGRLDEALDRLRRLNFWDPEDVEAYWQEVGDRWEKASRIYWMLDFGGLSHPDGGLVVQPSWRIHPADPKVLTRRNRLHNENLTILLNIPWRFSFEKQWRPMISDLDLN